MLRCILSTKPCYPDIFLLFIAAFRTCPRHPWHVHTQQAHHIHSLKSSQSMEPSLYFVMLSAIQLIEISRPFTSFSPQLYLIKLKQLIIDFRSTRLILDMLSWITKFMVFKTCNNFISPRLWKNNWSTECMLFQIFQWY